MPYVCGSESGLLCMSSVLGALFQEGALDGTGQGGVKQRTYRQMFSTMTSMPSQHCSVRGSPAVGGRALIRRPLSSATYISPSSPHISSQSPNCAHSVFIFPGRRRKTCPLFSACFFASVLHLIFHRFPSVFHVFRKEPRHGKRLTLAATVATPQGPLLVYSAHLEVMRRYRLYCL